MRPQKTWLALLILCCLSAPAWAAQKSGKAVFPPVTSYNLDKQKVVLPQGMEGQTNLLILSFAPEQQKAVDSWMPVARALQHLNFSFRYYELPVFENENFIFRWWDVSSLRSNETDPESWRWIVPLFVSRKAFLRSLQIPDAKQVVVLLVDRQGQVLWRASGAMNAAARETLMTAAGVR